MVKIIIIDVDMKVNKLLTILDKMKKRKNKVQVAMSSTYKYKKNAASQAHCQIICLTIINIVSVVIAVKSTTRQVIITLP